MYLRVYKVDDGQAWFWFLKFCGWRQLLLKFCSWWQLLLKFQGQCKYSWVCVKDCVGGKCGGIGEYLWLNVG